MRTFVRLLNRNVAYFIVAPAAVLLVSFCLFSHLLGDFPPRSHRTITISGCAVILPPAGASFTAMPVLAQSKLVARFRDALADDKTLSDVEDDLRDLRHELLASQRPPRVLPPLQSDCGDPPAAMVAHGAGAVPADTERTIEVSQRAGHL